MPLRILAAATLMVCATVMAVYGVAGTSRLSGPVLFGLSATHGVHVDDLLIAGCWSVTLFIASVIVLGRR
ncbi:hypothetical protein [Nocardioides sp. Kera G14]|uniref:hypothetical protein n=1 Tax=Nocardioides sp. Kera G14 TaxID=2884264 RepID=UPI001D0F8109|nr:hypothetical protein [Nocardioides sp. Kera G14]UDY23103.1 hypothetical protein LH076_13680 [Nocardioides sp. Kera G14]